MCDLTPAWYPAHPGLNFCWQIDEEIVFSGTDSDNTVCKVISGDMAGFMVSREETSDVMGDMVPWIEEAVGRSMFSSDDLHMITSEMQSYWDSGTYFGNLFFWQAAFGSSGNLVVANSRSIVWSDGTHTNDESIIGAPLALYRNIKPTPTGGIDPTTDTGEYWEELGYVIMPNFNGGHRKPGSTNAAAGIIGTFYFGATIEDKPIEGDPGHTYRAVVDQDPRVISVAMSPDTDTTIVSSDMNYEVKCENIDSDGTLYNTWTCFWWGADPIRQYVDVCINGESCGHVPAREFTSWNPELGCSNTELDYPRQSRFYVGGSEKAQQGHAKNFVLSRGPYLNIWQNMFEIGTDVFTGARSFWNNGKPVYFSFPMPLMYSYSDSEWPWTGDSDWMINIDDTLGIASLNGDFRKTDSSWIHKSGLHLPEIDANYMPIWIDDDQKYFITNGPNLPAYSVETGEMVELLEGIQNMVTSKPVFFDEAPTIEKPTT